MKFPGSKFSASDQNSPRSGHTDELFKWIMRILSRVSGVSTTSTFARSSQRPVRLKIVSSNLCGRRGLSDEAWTERE